MDATYPMLHHFLVTREEGSANVTVTTWWRSYYPGGFTEIQSSVTNTPALVQATDWEAMQTGVAADLVATYGYTLLAANAVSDMS